MDSIYDRLSNISFLSNSYSFKFMFIAFIGVNIPLIFLILFIYSDLVIINQDNFVLVIMFVILVAAFITWFLVNKLLIPLKLSKLTLENYLTDRTLPSLPSNYKDEVGVLMKKIQLTLLSLDELIREKKDFTALLSHDIRTPFSQFIGLSELIKEETDKDRINNYCDLIIQQSQAQLDFLKDIMEIMEHDNVTLQKQNIKAFPLNDLIRQAVLSVQSQAHKKGVNIKVAENISISIRVQSKLFVQVLQNLLTNAIKFSYPGKSIRVHATSEKNKIKIQVCDEGIGFNAEDEKQLFQRHTRKGRTGTAGEKSTGLGLYLSQMIIKKHNGKIIAKSDGKNTGSVFTIELPAN